MNILYHHRTMARGAEGTHIVSIVNALSALGHEVDIVSPPGIDPLSDCGEKPLDKVSQDTKGIKTLWKNISRHAPEVFFELLEIAYNFYALYKILEVLRHREIDLIYERNAYFLFAGGLIAKWKKIPLVIESNEVVGIKRARPLVMKSVASFIEKFSFDQARGVLTVSSYLRECISRVTGTPAKVTPNAIDPAKFSRETRRGELREKFGLKDKIVIGFAGWFDWWDRLDLLLSALKRLDGMGFGNAAAFIIGDGALADDLKKSCRDLGIEEKVIFTGPVGKKDIVDYLDVIDVVLFPHSNDFGSPVALFEFMSLGKIIVAPDLMPMTDVIEDGISGYIFPKLDLDAMVEKLALVLSDFGKTKRAGDKAKELVFSKHTWENNAKMIIGCLE